MNRHYHSVADRAAHRCEYCHAPETAFNFHLEVEHILPLSLGGTDDEDNLALACQSCNLFKAIQVTTFDALTQRRVNLFHPRLLSWDEHFRVELETGLIQGLTATGRATIESLQINSAAQVRARLQWMRLGLFP